MRWNLPGHLTPCDRSRSNLLLCWNLGMKLWLWQLRIRDNFLLRSDNASFFFPLRGHFAIVHWCRGIFSDSRFLMSDPASPLLIWVYLDVFFNTSKHTRLWNHIHRSSAAAAQNVESKSHSQRSCPGVARAEQPQRRRDKLPVSTCMRPAETENSGKVNYLARRASPCCSHLRARFQMLRHLRRAVEEPLAARPRCSSDDSAQTHVVGSARVSQLSCKKVFVVKERKNIWMISIALELILCILFELTEKKKVQVGSPMNNYKLNEDRSLG